MTQRESSNDEFSLLDTRRVSRRDLIDGNAAMAETMSFKADPKGSEEVPPTTSSGTGNLTASYDTTGKKLSWKGTLQGLTGNPTAAHFHGPAEPGKNASPLVPAPGVKMGAFEGPQH
jgi:hypothetical protein